MKSFSITLLYMLSLSVYSMTIFHESSREKYIEFRSEGQAYTVWKCDEVQGDCTPLKQIFGNPTKYTQEDIENATINILKNKQIWNDGLEKMPIVQVLAQVPSDLKLDALKVLDFNRDEMYVFNRDFNNLDSYALYLKKALFWAGPIIEDK